MTVTNKRYSYPKVAAIWIDVHPAGENPTNTTRMFPTLVHVRPMYASCERSPYVATFRETPTDLDKSHCSREKGLPTQSTARRLTDSRAHTQLLSWASQWSRERKPSSWRWPTTRFTGPISPACDRYVQYLLTGVNPSVLNRHRRGLQPWKCRLHIPLFDLPNQLSSLSLKGPARFQVIHTTFTNRTGEGTSPKSHECESPLDFYRNLSSKHSMS
jgi:hypothetical protein